MGVELLRRADLRLPPALLMRVLIFVSAQPSLDSYLWWRVVRVGMDAEPCREAAA
jgi:hypothetical protein